MPETVDSRQRNGDETLSLASSAFCINAAVCAVCHMQDQFKYVEMTGQVEGMGAVNPYGRLLSLLNLLVSSTKRFKILELTLCPHCIYVFCIYLRTNSNLCHLQHKLIGFYNRDEKCLQRGTDWVFK